MASRSAFAAIQRRETGVTPSRAPVAPAADFIWASLLTRSVMFKDGFQQQLGCFDVGFSDDGSVAVGCMEDASVHVIDHRQGARGCGAGWCVGSLRGHTDPVNHHTFLDSHRLLTASDDTTVLLWDLRCMGGGGDAPSRAMVDSFHGHKNWVKNIELLSSTHFLSSDLGGDIRLWDVRLDGLRQNPRPFATDNAILSHRGLCRMTVVRDKSDAKLVVCLRDTSTSEAARRGSTIVIHGLNLEQQMRERAEGRVSVSRLVSSRDLSRMSNLHKPLSGTRRQCSYVNIPLVAFAAQNRPELLHERPGFTLSVVGGPLQTPHRQWLLARRNIVNAAQQHEIRDIDVDGAENDQDHLCLYLMSDQQGGQSVDPSQEDPPTKEGLGAWGRGRVSSHLPDVLRKWLEVGSDLGQKPDACGSDEEQGEAQRQGEQEARRSGGEGHERAEFEVDGSMHACMVCMYVCMYVCMFVCTWTFV